MRNQRRINKKTVSYLTLALFTAGAGAIVSCGGGGGGSSQENQTISSTQNNQTSTQNNQTSSKSVTLVKGNVPANLPLANEVDTTPDKSRVKTKAVNGQVKDVWALCDNVILPGWFSENKTTFNVEVEKNTPCTIVF